MNKLAAFVEKWYSVKNIFREVIRNVKRDDKSQLNSQISSYLLNTVSNAVSASDLLARHLDQLPPVAQPAIAEYLSILRRSQFQLQRMAENLRELSELEGGTGKLRTETVDLAELCSALVDGIRTLLPDVSLRLEACAEPCITVCDPDRIERLLLNLLSNSLLHLPTDGAIRILLQRTPDTIQVVVSDNGSGIPRERMDTLFSDFVQDGGLPEAGRGAGIGLAVASLIARAHGGSLVITSGEGRGTKAVFSIPCVSSGMLRSSPAPQYGRMRNLLAALSDVLPHDRFQPPFL